MASLKDTIARKDEEIERLQNNPTTKSPSLRRNLSSLKNGPSSPSGKSSIETSPQRSPTISNIRRTGNRSKSASDQDTLSDSSDPVFHAIEDDENEGLRVSRSMTDLNGPRDSDSDLSAATDNDTDGTSEASFSHKTTKSSDGGDKYVVQLLLSDFYLHWFFLTLRPYNCTSPTT